jgi:hypothetical protein
MRRMAPIPRMINPVLRLEKPPPMSTKTTQAVPTTTRTAPEYAT